MHLPFNEGYIKSMRTAFPEDKIIFAATARHIENITPFIEPFYNIEFAAIENFDDLLAEKSYHNPFYSLPAARKCWKSLTTLANNEVLRHVCLLGANGPLIYTFAKKWQSQQRNTNASIHYIQHNQLSTSMRWRSRNPIYKYFDYLSVISRGLPNNQKLVLLELGLAEVLAEIAPKIQPSMVTIEHPVQEREWLPAKVITENSTINIGFLGNCGVGKGFDQFLKLASEYSGNKYQFYAIGKNNITLTNELSFDGLKVKPADAHLPRDTFIKLLAEIDIVCLPLPKTTSYVSSGSIIDAFAASRPLIISTNQSVRSIQQKYGDYGFVYSNAEELHKFLRNLTLDTFKKSNQDWLKNIEKIKQNRSEKGIAKQLQQAIS